MKWARDGRILSPRSVTDWLSVRLVYFDTCEWPYACYSASADVELAPSERRQCCGHQPDGSRSGRAGLRFGELTAPTRCSRQPHDFLSSDREFRQAHIGFLMMASMRAA